MARKTASPITRTLRRRRAEALRKRTDTIYRPQQRTHAAAVLSNSLVQVGNVLTDAIGAGPAGNSIPVVNFGRPADAIYRPASPETTVIAAGVKAAGYGGGQNPTGPTDPATFIIYHNQLLGLDQGHPHPQYLRPSDGDLRYILRSEYDTTIDHTHPILDHTTEQTARHLLGTTLDYNLGWFQTTTNADDKRDAVLMTDGDGRVTVGTMIANDGVETPQVTATNSPLTLAGSPGVFWQGILSSPGAITGRSGISLNADTGEIDARSFTADEARFKVMIADATRAEAGSVLITTSRAQVSRAFTVPAVGSTIDVTFFELDGLAGYAPIGDGNDVVVNYYEEGDGAQPGVKALATAYDRAANDEDTEIYSNDFESDSGQSVADWRDLAPGNSTEADDAIYVVDDDGTGNNNVFRTEEAGSDYHTLYIGAGYKTLANYQFSGRFRMHEADAGVGFVILSNYEDDADPHNPLAAYRITRDRDRPTFVFSSPTEILSGGAADSGYNPATETALGNWISFKIRATVDTERTRIWAKFWNAGSSEPTEWQIVAYDESAGRRQAGTFGLWGAQATPGNGVDYDDLEANNLAASSTGDPVVHLDDDFESYSIGNAAGDWRDTGASNSMVEDDTLFTVYNDSGNQVLRTSSGAQNFHTHWNGTGASSLSAYEYTGRLKIANTNAGTGITLFSKYGPSGSDTYYRIRRYAASTNFHVSNHGVGTVTGTTTTTFDPGAAGNVGNWINFKAQIEDTGSRTELRAKFWKQGDSEPASWQIDCYDDTGSRSSAGTFGFWGFNDGTGVNYDDVLVTDLAATQPGSANSTIEINTPANVENGDYLAAYLTSGADATITAPAGWTAVTKETLTNDRSGHLYRKTASSEPATWQFSADNEAELHGVVAVIEASAQWATGYDSGENVTTLTGDDFTHSANGGLSIIFASRLDKNANTWQLPDDWSAAGSSRSEESAIVVYERLYAGSAATGDVDVSSAEALDGVLMHLAYSADADTSAAFGVAWGNVTKKTPQPAGLLVNEVVYEWTTLANAQQAGDGVGALIQPGIWAVDYGQNGDAAIELRAVGPGAPFIDFIKRGADPTAAPTLGTNLMGRMGLLDAIAGYDGVGVLFVDDNGAVAKFATSGHEQRNVTSNYYDGANLFLAIDATNGIQLVDATAENDHQRGYTWRTSGGTIVAGQYCYYSGGTRVVSTTINESETASKKWQYYVTSPNGYDSEFYIQVANSGSSKVGILQLKSGINSGNNSTALLAADEMTITAYQNVWNIDGSIRRNAGESKIRVYNTLEMHGTLTPNTSGTRLLGTSLAAWSDAYAVNTHTTYLRAQNAGSPSLRIQDSSANNFLAFHDSGTIRLVAEYTEAHVLYEQDRGTSGGVYLAIERNNNGSTPAAGSLALETRSGSRRYIWPDNSGNLRINTSLATYSTDTSGTVIGTQTSHAAAKDLLGAGPTPGQALATILASTVYRFRYKDGHGDTSQDHVGIITDERPEFSQDHGRAFSPVDAMGYTIQAIKALQQKIEQLEERLNRYE